MWEQFEQMNRAIAPSEQLVQRTRQRMAQTKQNRWLKPLRRAVVTVLCTLIIFTGAVNLSPAFASATAKVPVVRELTRLVSFDPSLKAAIDHNYVQLVKQSDQDGEFSLEVEYLVADQANLTLYYYLRGIPEGQETAYDTMLEVYDANGNKLEGYGASWDPPMENNNGLRCAKIYVTEGKLPERLQLEVTVRVDRQQLEALIAEEAGQYVSEEHYRAQMGEEQRSKQEDVAHLQVMLSIDHDSLFNVRRIAVNRTIAVKGQRLTVTQAEIYPTQMRIFWQADAANDCYITDIHFSLQGKQHRRWERISNGVVGIGDVDEPRQSWLESSWFDDQELYQLQVDDISLLPKENRTVTYDYQTGTIAGLPDAIKLVEVEPVETGLYMIFQVQSTNESVSMVFRSDYLDGDGNLQSMNGQGANSYARENACMFENDFVVKNYQHGPITLTLNWGMPVPLVQPIVIPLTEVETDLEN